ncbi:phospholipase A2-like isoform X3 [Biomphalaria glabrata]|uniref:Phospholipase A2-like isoform X3 n=1 Tax=Biomphalaria glabrata TaxID=6526 RepID=A0A9W2YKG0_BIOGL|nr:phospholipase A2-like isoform X3 [Biomphalaria glabrata]
MCVKEMIYVSRCVKDFKSTFWKENFDNFYMLDTLSLSEMANSCQLNSIESNTHKHLLRRRSIFNILEGIYPGTKWCGDGSLAVNYTDLGFYNDTDICCREHDHCDEFILPGKSKYGILNDQQYTICSCDCDKRLRSCLQNVGTFTSRAVGVLFFNVVGTRCMAIQENTLAGFSLGRTAYLVSPKPFNEGRPAHSFSEVLAGNVSVTGWLGSLLG